MIVIGSHWETGPWRSESREIVIEAIPYDDDVEFRFVDTGRTSTCSATAFLRTYVEMP